MSLSANLQLFDKVSSLVHFDYFSSQARFFCIVYRRFQKDLSKTEVSKVQIFMKCSLPVKNIQNVVPTVHKIAISRETKSFGTVCLFFLDSMDLFGIFNQIIQKTQCLQIVICSLLQAKLLVITQEKRCFILG